MKIYKVLVLMLAVCLSLSMLVSCNKEEKADDKSTAGNSSADAENSSVESNDESSEEGEASEEAAETSETAESKYESVSSEWESTDGDYSDHTDIVSEDDVDGDSDVNTDLPVPSLVAKDNGDGTVTVSLKLPSGVANGEIIVTASDKLNYIIGSAVSEIGVLNDTGAFDGVFVAFAAADFYAEGTTALSLSYRIDDGAALSEEDFWCDDWQIGDGTKWLSKKGQSGCKELVIFE